MRLYARVHDTHQKQLFEKHNFEESDKNGLHIPFLEQICPIKSFRLFGSHGICEQENILSNLLKKFRKFPGNKFFPVCSSEKCIFVQEILRLLKK